MIDKRKFYINGKWIDPIKQNDLEVINPSNEDSFATISLGSKEDVDAAVQSARKAFDNWKETTKNERISLRLNNVDNEEGVFLNSFISEDIP